VNHRARALCTACAAVCLCLSIGCGPTLTKPPMIAAPVADFVEVPYPPPAARTEIVPARPSGSNAWVDGQWSWDGKKWRWVSGGWVAAPAGATFQPWMVTRRRDGQVVYAPAKWRDAEGREVDAPVMARATVHGRTQQQASSK
jgi:hypothetical protein